MTDNPFESPATPPQGANDGTRDAVFGFFVHIGLSVAIPVVLIAVYVGLILGMFIGVAQVLWGVPLAIWARGRGRTAFSQGVLAAMAMVFMLNAACFGILLSSDLGFH